MILFIDTEWADALANELVSLALVSDCGRFEFYAEREPLPSAGNDFVRDVVYPLLERGKRAVPDPQFTHLLHEFFGTAQRAAKPKPLTVAYDHRNDLDLLGIALEGFDRPESPPRPWFAELELRTLGRDYERAVEQRFASDRQLAGLRHHALVDARVNRDAWLQLQRSAATGAGLEG
jgi:hypothetical protein